MCLPFMLTIAVNESSPGCYLQRETGESALAIWPLTYTKTATGKYVDRRCKNVVTCQKNKYQL